MRPPASRLWLSLLPAVLFALARPADAAPSEVTKGSGIEVTAQVRPAAGAAPASVPAGQVPFQVVLRLRGVTDPHGASVRYTVTGAARLLGQDTAPLRAAAESVREATVSLDPARRAYLNVFTAQGGRTGVVSVPLGDASAKVLPQAKAAPDSSGRPLVVLPARLR